MLRLERTIQGQSHFQSLSFFVFEECITATARDPQHDEEGLVPSYHDKAHFSEKPLMTTLIGILPLYRHIDRWR